MDPQRYYVRQDEMTLTPRITRRFTQTSVYEEEAEIIPEIEVWVSEKQMRRPDLAFYTRKQIAASKSLACVIPGFLIEFVSGNDDAREYIRKLHEYFLADVQTVWLIFPDDYTIYVYTSLKTVTICTDDVVSAGPALSALAMTVAELFRK